ncbi:unnamed protein product [Schistosoma rodhaini]|uniref:Uncharacterized protein n=1 Tax=Schistosoma rodhaini TaxID=6188 RepID=A0AA85G551_9TREM|nr:unnamed protein product [Schistosoma rodhaini]
MYLKNYVNYKISLSEDNLFQTKNKSKINLQYFTLTQTQTHTHTYIQITNLIKYVHE